METSSPFILRVRRADLEPTVDGKVQNIVPLRVLISLSESGTTVVGSGNAVDNQLLAKS